MTLIHRAALTLCTGMALSLSAPAARCADITGKVEATPAKYLADTVVYVEKATAPAAAKTARVDQKGMQFLPHLLTITAGDTVEFLNSDGVDHNVYSPDNEGFNLGMIPNGGKGKYTFAKPGTYSELCSVHPEMLGYVFVGQNPYAAAVGKDGTYKISNVPPGSYTVAVWNAHLKVAPAKVDAAEGKPATANFSLKR